MITIQEALFNELSSVAGLNSNKVYPLQAPQGTQTPYATLKLNDNDRTMILSGFDGAVDGEYQIDIYHNNYKNLMDLKGLIIQKIKSFLFRILGTTGPYCQSVSIDSEIETYDPDTKLWQGTIDITISYKEV